VYIPIRRKFISSIQIFVCLHIGGVHMYVSIHVCIYVCEYTCMYICMLVYMYVYMYVTLHVVYIPIRRKFISSIQIFVCLHIGGVHMYVSIHVCMYVSFL
jgi:hypothetical protein